MSKKFAATIVAVLWIGLTLALDSVPVMAVTPEQEKRLLDLAIDQAGKAVNRSRKKPPKHSGVDGYSADDPDRPYLVLNVVYNETPPAISTDGWRWDEFFEGAENLRVDPEVFRAVAESAYQSTGWIKVAEPGQREADWQEQDMPEDRMEASTMPPKGHTWGSGFEVELYVLRFAKKQEEDLGIDLGRIDLGYRGVDYGITILARVRDRTTSTLIWPDGRSDHGGVFTAIMRGEKFEVGYGKRKFLIPLPPRVAARFQNYPGVGAIWSAAWAAAEALKEEFVLQQAEVRDYVERHPEGIPLPEIDQSRPRGVISKVNKESVLIDFGQMDGKIAVGQTFEIFTPSGFDLMVDQSTQVRVVVNQIVNQMATANVVEGSLKRVKKGFVAVQVDRSSQEILETGERIEKPQERRQTWADYLESEKAQVGTVCQGLNPEKPPVGLQGLKINIGNCNNPETFVDNNGKSLIPTGTVVGVYLVKDKGSVLKGKIIFHSVMSDGVTLTFSCLPGKLDEIIAGIKSGWQLWLPEQERRR